MGSNRSFRAGTDDRNRQPENEPLALLPDVDARLPLINVLSRMAATSQKQTELGIVMLLRAQNMRTVCAEGAGWFVTS
jgi:hypothetical protein